MIRSLIKIAVVVVVAILVYNYFFGDRAEKEQSRKIFGEMRDVVVSVGQLVKTEKQKFDAGKYDGALDKLGDAYRAIRGQAENLDGKVMQRLDELERRKAQLQREVDAIEQIDTELQSAPQTPPKKGAKAAPIDSAKTADQDRRKAELQRQIEALVRDTDDLLKEAQE